MNINNTNSIQSIYPKLSINNTSDESSFGKILKDSIEKLDIIQKKSDNSINDLINNKDIELHEVMLNMEEAKTSLKLAIEIRNKLLESYSEINKIQV